MRSWMLRQRGRNRRHGRLGELEAQLVKVLRVVLVDERECVATLARTSGTAWSVWRTHQCGGCTTQSSSGTGS